MNNVQRRVIGHLVRKERIAQHLSAQTVADRAGINKSTLIRIENGDIANPTVDSLKHIGDVLDIPVADLYTAAGWLPSSQLPTPAIYLKAKFKHLPPSAIAEIETHIERIAATHDRAASGPQPGEDE